MKEDKVITQSFWSLNCREATFLTEMSKEGKLSLSLRIRLWYHLSICQSCKNFRKQTLLLAARLKELKKNRFLDSSDKQRFQEEIKKAMEKK